MESHFSLAQSDYSSADAALQQSAKRVFDLVAASLLLVVLAPLLAMVALLVKLDGGPAGFAQPRIGRDGKRFPCFKFRTMVPNAEAVLKEVLAANPAMAQEWQEERKLRVDPRITRIGGFLRRSSIDELPQIINVIRGEMSLVGPRPVPVYEWPRYGENAKYYRLVRPGITGLWQVNGRNDVDYERRTALDAAYVRNWSFGTDLAILAKTIPAVLGCRGV